MESTLTKNSVPQEVKESSFGCPNCLWNGVECNQGNKYKEELGKTGKKHCATYNYYD